MAENKDVNKTDKVDVSLAWEYRVESRTLLTIFGNEHEVCWIYCDGLPVARIVWTVAGYDNAQLPIVAPKLEMFAEAWHLLQWKTLRDALFVSTFAVEPNRISVDDFVAYLEILKFKRIEEGETNA